MKTRPINDFLIFFLIFLFILAPISPSKFFPIRNFSAKADSAENVSGYQEWDTDKTIDKNISILSGATLVIKPGVVVTFDGGEVSVDGTMVASGTIKKPVIFKKADGSRWAYSISVKTDGKLIMRNADVSGGGYSRYTMKKNSIFNSALASGIITGGIDVNGGWLDVENSSFHDNKTAIFVGNQNLDRIKVNRSKFFNNESFDAYYCGSSGNNLDFKYNWWGNSNGPSKICDSGNSCWYEKFEGEVDFSNWLTSENFRDPVIIIPGILGSEKKNGTWQIDPIFHAYDNLYEEFAENGYVPGEDLFTFPYEWRNSNVENAKLLKIRIQEIKQQENWPKVDVVAHSMGGLLAREYIESDEYGNDIDQLIALGTPNNGAPIAYLKWEAGAFLSDYQEIFMKYYFNHEAKESGFDNVFHYIQNKITSVKELLPVHEYLYDTENNNDLIVYNEINYPINEFLENLNDSNRKLNLLKVESNKIIGNVISPVSTVAGFNVIKTDMGEYWVHGYPLGFEIPIGDRGLTMGNGDRTVPIESAKSENIYADNLIELNSSHIKLPTNAQKDVLEILTGIRPSTEVNHSLIRDILFVSVFSPVDIQIVAPNGKRVGKDFESGEIINEIEGAYYSGFDSNNEFLTIPNPVDGKYKIFTQGTGDGNYKIEVAKITEDSITGIASESMAAIEGTAVFEQEKEEEVRVEGSEVSVVNQDTVPPVISILSPEENKNYLNNQTIGISYNVSDDVSQNIKTEVFLNGGIFTDQNVNLSFHNIGEHTLKITAADEVGNKSEKEVRFEVKTDIQSIIDNVNIYSSQGLIRNMDKTILTYRLNLIRELDGMIESIKHNVFLRSRLKEFLVKALKDQINWNLDWLTNYVQQRSRVRVYNGINPKVGWLLIESFNFVKYK